MKFALCFILPPLAVLLCGKPIQAVVNVFLTICGVLPGVVHAMYTVVKYDERKLLESIYCKGE